MGRTRSNFERWKARVPAKTRELAELVETRLVTRCEADGFSRVDIWMGDKEFPVRGDEIQLERAAGAELDVIDVSFASYGAMRFQLGCARRRIEPPHAFVRSGMLVATRTEYFHFWGKPPWRPGWSWSKADAKRTVERVEGKLDQIFAFLESGVVGLNISRQDVQPLRRSNNSDGKSSASTS